MAVTTMSHLAGSAVAVIIALTIAADPTAGDFAWGALGGIAGAGGLMSIYAGYARARVSIAAPLAGVGAASLPVIVDAATTDESLSTLTIVGVLLGLLAIGLTSMGKSEGTGTIQASVAYGVGGALGLGLMLLVFSKAGDDAGMWPLVSARSSGFVALLAVVLVTGQKLTVARSEWWLIVGIACLGTGANAFFIAATRVGSTAVAAVVTSMFPAVTVLWAWRVFGERLRRVQLIGLGIALVAVALIALG